MSRLVKKLLNLIRGSGVRSNSVTSMENEGTSAQRHKSQPHMKQHSGLARNTNTSNFAIRSTSRTRKRKLTSTVTLEQMKKDGIIKFINAGCLSAADIWGDRMIPDVKLNHTVTTHDSQVDTNANPAPFTTNEKGPSVVTIWKRNSADWDVADCLSIEEIMRGKNHDHTVATHDSQVDNDVTVAPCHRMENGESLSIIGTRNSQQSHSGPLPKKRKLNDVFDDMDDLPRPSTNQSQNSNPASNTHQLDTTSEQTNHTISTQKSQVDTSSVPEVTTAAEQSQTSSKIKKRKKGRATRRRGKKRKQSTSATES